MKQKAFHIFYGSLDSDSDSVVCHGMVEWLETKKDITCDLVLCFSLRKKKKKTDREIVRIKRQEERNIMLVLFIGAYSVKHF